MKSSLVVRPQLAALLLVLLLLATRAAAQVDGGEGSDNGTAEADGDIDGDKGEDDTEFAFNIFSDIAPILALFGEQFATQFASESMTWLDHLVFAAVPLGILTAITGAIRVQGPKIARSFIGRARENRALAEIELMSSTSAEVCELFNGKAIVRAMGRPKMAQIIIFPDRYDELEDRDDDPDKSCGIHTLQTAISTEDGTIRPIMQYKHYHSRSYRMFTRWWKQVMGQKIKDSVSATWSDDEERFREQPNPKWLGPPNLQLNLSSDHSSRQQKTVELFVAAAIAIFLQLGVLVVAAFTAFHEPTKVRLSYEPTRYGFAAYVIGSVMLFVGMAICSVAIEQSTTEFSWVRSADTKPAFSALREKESADGSDDGTTPLVSHVHQDPKWAARPRLLWLQADQSVSDQSFGSFVVLAGAKRYVVTSSRFEDARASHQAQQIEYADTFGRRYSTGTYRRPYLSRHDSQMLEQKTSNATWETLTMIGVFSAGAGFILQFIGLRGLAFPCSIAQLGAIFIMAMIRSIIRRRLGRIPKCCAAPAEHEIDFLAINITFCREFREFRRPTDQNKHLGILSPHGICQWKVITPVPRSSERIFFRVRKGVKGPNAAKAKMSVDIQKLSMDAAQLGTDQEAPIKKATVAQTEPESNSRQEVDMRSVASYFDHATSQQLLKVRERLGNLCGWEGRSSEAALALSQSIEAFMAVFGQRIVKKRFEWVVDSSKPSSDSTLEAENDTFTLSVVKKTDRWEADLGRLDAVLSLWLANIEAENVADARESQEPDSSASRTASDWRRAKAGTGSKYTFCRILGDDFDDEVLKRDISWWVDELIADQSAIQDPSTPGTAAARYDPSVKLIIGFNGGDETVDKRRSAQSTPKELAIVSTGSLPTILAQHIFTSFMWAIADELPRDCLQQGAPGNEQEVGIEGPDEFDPFEFSQTNSRSTVESWYRPTLKHRGLTKLLREMEATGMGTVNDIMLCMIPALSFTDRLPNGAMLRLMPRVGHGQGWIETARCYRTLLDTSIGIQKEEHFAYDVVAATMDFLYLAYEPYDEFKWPDVELKPALADIVRNLISKYRSILQKLMPFYEIQHRAETFRRIFKWVADESHDWMQKKDDVLDMEFAVNRLGFGDGHKHVVMAIASNSKGAKAQTPLDRNSFGREGADAMKPDIFGLTPLHYACYSTTGDALESVMEALAGRPSHKILDEIRRSPVHVAALLGQMDHVEALLEDLPKEDQKIAVNMPGLDGMTALHLAAAAGNVAGVKKFLRMLDRAFEYDIWGRGALHIAVRKEHAEIVSELLKSGSRPEHQDKRGETVLSYLRKNEEELTDAQKSIGSELMKFWKDFEARDDQGRTPLHHAAEFGDEEAIRKFCEYDADAIKGRDVRGRTPLHAAIIGNRPDTTLLLIEMGSSLTARDSEDVTALMFACQGVHLELIKKLMELSEDPAPLEQRDNAGRTALHHAVWYADPDIIRSIIELGANLEVEDESGHRPLHAAVWRGRLDVVQLLIDMGADMRARDRGQETILMHSCQKDLDDITKLILDVAPDLADLQDEAGRTALYHSVTSPEEIPASLINTMKDINTRDKIGRTALHHALCWVIDSAAVILLKAGADSDTFDNEGNSPLITASQNGCVGAVELMVAARPDLINQKDKVYGQTALAWACENERVDVAKVLLACNAIDPNIPATSYGYQTPMHFAVAARNVQLVDLLMAHSNIDIMAEDGRGLTPGVVAFSRDEMEIVSKLMSDERVSDAVRVRSLMQFCSLSGDDAFALFPAFLSSIPNEALTDDDLAELLRRSSVRLQSLTAFQACLDRAMDRAGWKQLRLLLNMAARAGDLSIVQKLLDQRVDPTQRDEDGWSAMDYAESYHNIDILELLKRHMQQRRPKSPHFLGYRMPVSLVKSQKQVGVRLDGCDCDPQSGDCKGLTRIRVEAKDPSKMHATLRTEGCIPPNAPYWYFEMKILKTNESKTLGLGFGDELIDIHSMPGWFSGAWAWHGDDGRVFIEDEWTGDKPSDDFGEPAAYSEHEGWVVGCGLDMESGRGYCTINGKRLDMADVFDEDRFHVGKMYPVVGFDVEERGVGLDLEVILQDSPAHPFMYRGPYDCP